MREVWFWENDAFHLHALAGDAYAPIAKSALLPDLDPEALARVVRMGDQHRAVRAYLDLLRG